MKTIELNLICRFGGGGNVTPPKPPVPPSQDVAAQNLLMQGKKRPPVGFDSTLLGDNTSPNASVKKTLLGA